MNNNWNRNKNRGGRNIFRGNSGSGFRSNRGFRGSYGNNRGSRQNYNDGYAKLQWRPRDMPSKRLSEKDIGITEYISDQEGFNGIIKSRFSDFQVSEINEQGEVAKLTDLSVPTVAVEEDVLEDEDLLLNKYNLEILPMDTWDSINKITVSADRDIDPVRIDVTGMSKEERTRIHDSVKKAFGESIVGSTVTENDKKYVVFQKYKKGVRIDNRVKWVWPEEYVHFIVYKENCDTMEAAARIAERLRLNIKPSMVGYAGTKDRRAKTSQWFSLRKVDPRKISAACKDLREIHVGNFSFSASNLKLGMLKGNVFRICLRNVSASDECISRACELLRDRGFVNYYGLQRFGSRPDAPTYELGKQILLENYDKVIESILSDRSGPLQHALHVYRASGPGDALRALPRSQRASAEARVLKALAHCPTDLRAALDQIARNTRLLYLHSYQSLVWNRAVSERLRRHSHAPVVGDLVPLDVVEEVELENESDNEETDDQSGSKSDSTDKTETTDNKPTENKRTDNQPKKIIPVKALTQADLNSGSYTIFDVILPLPGYSIEYPPNMIDYYKELLEKDGLKLDLRHKYKSYSLCGGYRRIVLRPTELKWNTVSYNDPLSDLILSDRDELEGNTQTGIVQDGKYKALLLTMSLPTSCYATMALRELLRVDTSSDTQASQNDYHKTDTNKVEKRKTDENDEGDVKKAKIDNE